MTDNYLDDSNYHNDINYYKDNWLWGNASQLRLNRKMTMDHVNEEFAKFISLVYKNGSFYVDPYDPRIEMDLFNVIELRSHIRTLCRFISIDTIKRFKYERMSDLMLTQSYYKDKK